MSGPGLESVAMEANASLLKQDENGHSGGGVGMEANAGLLKQDVNGHSGGDVGMEANAGLMKQDVNGHSGGGLQANVVVSTQIAKDLKGRGTRANLIRTAFDGLLVVFLGMQASQKGPAFLDLQQISGTGVEGASTYFTANSFGYMMGALVAGVLYDKTQNKMMLVCFPLTLAAFLIGLTPWCTAYGTMLLAHFASATQCSIPETVITADQLKIWQGKSEGAIQFLSFTYSLGGVLGPLYTEPFLAPKWNKVNTSQDLHEQNLIINNLSQSQNYQSDNYSTNLTLYTLRVESNQTVSVSNEPLESDLHYAYLISGIFGLVFSIPFYVLFVKHCSKISRQEKKKEPVEKEEKRLTLKPYVILSGIACIFFYFYTLTEDSFNMFLSMFVVSHLSWTKESGALISSLYWGIGTVSKLLSVLLLRCLDLGHLLLFSVVGMVVSLFTFLLASHYEVDVLIWISSSVFALSQSSIFGGCFSWVDTHIVKLDGKATSGTMIFASFGSMSGPFFIGLAMERFSYMVFPYIEVFNSVIACGLFLFMYFFVKPYGTRRYGPVRPKSENTIIVSANDNDCAEEVMDEKERMMTGDSQNDVFILHKENGKI